MKYMRKNGFTLIELLVVIALIGILATLVVSNMNSARERARDAQRKSDMRNIQTALRLYYNDYAGYPASSAGQITGCGTLASATNCAWGSAWVRNGITYMSILVRDPLSSQSYVYTGVAGNEDYTLKACLENRSDEKGVADATCPSGYKYEVKP